MPCEAFATIGAPAACDAGSTTALIVAGLLQAAGHGAGCGQQRHERACCEACLSQRACESV